MSDEPFPDSLGPDMTRDTLYRLMEQTPADLTHYGGMADEMDELGYPSLAHAYRWMWKRGKYPLKRERYSVGSGSFVGPGHAVPKSYRWGWYREGSGAKRVYDVYPAADREPHELPKVVLLQPHKYYASHQAAVMDLAKWLQRLKDAHDLEPRRAA